MTPDQLVLALTDSSKTARDVLALIAAYPEATGDLSVQVGGATVTIPGLSKQRAQAAADRAVDRLGAATDLTGAVVSQTITRDTLRRIVGVRSKLSSGYTVALAYARSNQLISSISVTAEDALGNTVAGPFVRTVQRDTAGLYAGMN